MHNRLVSTLLSLTICAPALLAQDSNTSTPIKHVVVIFQENVSFDHYFATYPNAANTTAGEPEFHPSLSTPSVDGLSGPLLTANPNSAQPFRLTRAQAVTCDQDHNYADEQKAFNSGLMNKFVEAVGSSSSGCDVGGYGNKIVMRYYDGNTVTAFWNYAQNFAMSDNSFGTTFGPSTPGALNLVAGQTHGATVTSGSDKGSVSAGSVIGDPRPGVELDDCTLPKKTLIRMLGKNVGDLLNAKGIRGAGSREASSLAPEMRTAPRFALPRITTSRALPLELTISRTTNHFCTIRKPRTHTTCRPLRRPWSDTRTRRIMSMTLPISPPRSAPETCPPSAI